MATDTDEEYETKDLALTVALKTHGYKPIRLDLKGKEAFWVFEDCDALVTLTEAYEMKLLTVEPKMFIITLRETRDELFNFLSKSGVRPGGRGWSRSDGEVKKRPKSPPKGKAK